MSSTDAPPPALGELARRATAWRDAEDLLRKMDARTYPADGPNYREVASVASAKAAFIAACSPELILQLVALASGGAAGGLQHEQDLDKTEKNQQQEPEPKGESSARCECASCVAHRVYVFGLRCCPRGLTRGVNYMVYALPKLSAFPHSHRRLPK